MIHKFMKYIFQMHLLEGFNRTDEIGNQTDNVINAAIRLWLQKRGIEGLRS